MRIYSSSLFKSVFVAVRSNVRAKAKEYPRAQNPGYGKECNLGFCFESNLGVLDCSAFLHTLPGGYFKGSQPDR